MRPRGFGLGPHMLPICRALEDRRIENLMLIVGPGSGKALAPDTPVTTPNGSVAIKDIKVGDRITSPRGGTTEVLAVWPQPVSPLYRLTFSDGRTVVANGKHLWTVYQKKFAKRGEPMKWRERTTEEIAGHLWHERANMWYVPLTEPVEQPEQNLPIDPYMLGAIIGDGSIQPHGGCNITCFDGEILERLNTIQTLRGCKLTWLKNDKGGLYGLTGLGKKITSLGLAGCRSWNKFVPEIYKRGSLEQRWALMQGLFDTDGTVGTAKTVSYTSTSIQLAKDVQEIARSLGAIAFMSDRIPKYTHKDKKTEGKRAYTVFVRHRDVHRFFYLPRKVQRAIIPTQYAADLKLQIVRIEPVAEGPSVCISVAAQDGLFLCGDNVVTHNSNLLSVIYPAWRLGVSPETTILGISAGENLIQGFIRGTMELIEYSPQYQKYFPNTKPDKSAGWSTERGVFVTGHQIGDPDPSYWGAGLDSKSLGGKHAREIIMDDMHDDANSATVEQCKKVRDRYYNTVQGRADPRGARRVLAGRRWSEEDIYGHFSESGDWVVMTLPAERENSKERLYLDVRVPMGLECCFTDTLVPEPIQDESATYLRYRSYYGHDPQGQGFYWPNMKEKRKEYFSTKRNSPAVAQAVYQCDPGARKGAVFRREDFVYFIPPPGLGEGIRNSLVADWIAEKNGIIVQAWDTATGKSQASAYSVGITMMLSPSSQWHRGENEDYLGQAEHHYVVYVLAVYRKKIDFGELSSAVRAQHRLWRPRVVLVEDRSSGISLLQTLKSTGINIKGVKATDGKIERALDAIGGASGSVQGWSRQGRILFPHGEKTWLPPFEAELVDFSSDSAGKKDQVDAFVHGIVYAIQQGTKSIILPSEESRVEAVLPTVNPVPEIFSSFGALFADATDPFFHTCGGDNPCYYWGTAQPKKNVPPVGSWCRLHRRGVLSLDSCEYRRDREDVDYEEPVFG